MNINRKNSEQRKITKWAFSRGKLDNMNKNINQKLWAKKDWPNWKITKFHKPTIEKSTNVERPNSKIIETDEKSKACMRYGRTWWKM